jgi:hypothetical protein
MQMEELYNFVQKETGDCDVWKMADEVIKHRESHVSFVDELSGIERAEALLREREASLERSCREQKESWDTQLNAIEAEMRATDERSKADRLAALEARKGKNSTFFIESSTRIDKLQSQFDEAVSREIITSQRALLKSITNPLKEYRRAKFLRSLWRKLVVLSLVFVTFELGAGAIKDSFTSSKVRLVVVFALWFFQQFVADPFLKRRVEAKEREALKDTLHRFYWTSLWATAVKVLVNHDMQQRGSKRSAGSDPPKMAHQSGV